MKKFLKAVKRVVAVAGVGLALTTALPAKADLIVARTNQNYFIELPLLTLAGGGTTNFCPTQLLMINPGYGVGFEVAFTNSNSSATTNLAVYYFLTVDGTNFTTLPQFQSLWASNGNSTNRQYTNFIPALFDSAYGISCLISNGDAAHAIGFITKPRFTRKSLTPGR